MIGAFCDVLTASRTTLEKITIRPVFPAMDTFWTMKFPKLRSLTIEEVWMGAIRVDGGGGGGEDEPHPSHPRPTAEEIQARFRRRKETIVEFFLHHTTLEDLRVIRDDSPEGWMPDSFDPNSLPNLSFFMGPCDIFQKFIQSQLPCLGTSLRGLYLIQSHRGTPDAPPSPTPPFLKALQLKQKHSPLNPVLYGLKSLSIFYPYLEANSSNPMDDYIDSFRLWAAFCGDSLEVLDIGMFWYLGVGLPFALDNLVDMYSGFKQLRRLEMTALLPNEEREFDGRVRTLAHCLPKLEIVVLSLSWMTHVTARITRKRERLGTNIQGGEDSKDIDVELYRTY
jgi:hypothetical protein